MLCFNQIIGLIVNSYMPVVLGIHKKSECLAALLEIFRISGMLTSNLHIFALAVHQFVGIVYPLRYKMILTTRRQRLLIAVLWVVPLIFIFTWFVAIPNDGFRNASCRMAFYGRLPFRLSVFICFIVPLFATFALYTNIIITLVKAKAKCSTDLRYVFLLLNLLLISFTDNFDYLDVLCMIIIVKELNQN